MANDPLRAQRPLVFAPGGLGVSQFPNAEGDATLANAQSIEIRKLDTAVFPLGGLAASGSAVYGDLLTWDGAHWVNRSWVPGLGVGNPLVAGAALSVSGLTYLNGAVYAPAAVTL